MKQTVLFCVAMCLLAVVSLGARAATVHVGLGGGYTYNTIQDGINAAVNGDTVVVHDGTYTGVGNRDIDFGGRLITVTSANGAASTIIDCQSAGRGFYFHSGETNESVLQGFTIRNGDGPNGTWQGGGGIYCDGSSPTVSDCVFKDNEGGYGGGMNAWDGSDVRVIRCTFDGNTGFMGAGFWGNSSEMTLSSCVFLNNQAGLYGGAVRVDDSITTITNCLVLGNIADEGGGGIAFHDGGSMSILHSTIVGNSLTDSSTHEGGGIMVADTYDFLDVTNSILWDNEFDELYYRPTSVGVITVSYTDAQDSAAETWFDALTCIDEDPLFDAGYRLLWGSPCIDSGTDAGVYVDLDGNVRPLVAGFDMGCFEAIPEPSVLGLLGLGLLLAVRRLRK